jgi:hypothetical protein
MPSYQISAFKSSPVLMVGGQNVWLFGGFNDAVSPTKMSISQVAVASNVVTLTVQVTSGVIPAVGSLISVQGTTTDSGVANVSAVAITAVSISASTGAGTVSYAATGSNQSATADSGIALVPTPITLEALANGSSAPAASAENDPSENDERSYMAQAFFGSLPTTATVTLQASLIDQDSAYQNVGTVATVVGGSVTQNSMVFANANFRFLRFNVSGVTGGSSPTIAAALLG